MALSQSLSAYVSLPTPPETPTPAPRRGRLSANPTRNQSRNWCFTTNNYTVLCMDKVEGLADEPCVKYVVYGRERAPTTGTPHLQGFIQFTGNKSFSTVVDLLPFGSHVSKAVRPAHEAADYCRKDGDYFEAGPRPVKNAGARATAEKWSVAKAAAKRGALDEIDDDLFIKYYSTFKRIQKDYMAKPEPLGTCCGLWIYGSTGSGKTHSVVTQHPDRYIKPLNKWWDGYQGEDVVHLDELAPSHTSWIAPYLKKWADKWPFDAEVKGGAMQLRPKLIVVTSNYTMSEMGFCDADYPALARRFRQVQKFRDQDIIVQ
nr:rep protein [Cressdnaviricota sp.]